MLEELQVQTILSSYIQVVSTGSICVVCQYFGTFSIPQHVCDVCPFLLFTPKHCTYVALML